MVEKLVPGGKVYATTYGGKKYIIYVIHLSKWIEFIKTHNWKKFTLRAKFRVERINATIDQRMKNSLRLELLKKIKESSWLNLL